MDHHAVTATHCARGPSFLQRLHELETAREQLDKPKRIAAERRRWAIRHVTSSGKPDIEAHTQIALLRGARKIATAAATRSTVAEGHPMKALPLCVADWSALTLHPSLAPSRIHTLADSHLTSWTTQDGIKAISPHLHTQSHVAGAPPVTSSAAEAPSTALAAESDVAAAGTRIAHISAKVACMSGQAQLMQYGELFKPAFDEITALCEQIVAADATAYVVTSASSNTAAATATQHSERLR